MRRSSTNPDLSGCSLLALVVLHSTAFVVWWVYPGKVAWYFLPGIYIIIIIYSFTARVTGAPQVTSQPVFSFFSLFSTALWDLANSRPVHSLMLSSHLFLLLLCLLPPFTVPRKIVLARPDERVMVRRSSCGPLACLILAQTSSLVTWSFYEFTEAYKSSESKERKKVAGKACLSYL